MTDIQSDLNVSPEHQKLTRGHSTYCEDALRIARLVLNKYPSASAISLDVYLDDDSLDCGPVSSVDGTVLIDDVSDIEDGLEIERIVAGWSCIALLTSKCCSWFRIIPDTGESMIVLQRAIDPGNPVQRCSC
ncbi:MULTISPECIES: hypothetical protein [Arthrobacter]|uniref:hypothetical protein n=1 Tax=Arthrobacter TaxID=1663 RepID=UPI001D151F6A|nr:MULTISPECIES: hypothetical protein [Arthrobacter]MCC3283221.1 hypothetical protein [Arthrobacter caoxuetaonis]MCC9195102.1 hypothetical protein [Arthrobacter sp. zg-Y916]